LAFYVYENWTAEKKCVIHEEDCPHCNKGRGHDTNILGEKNGRWHGPFLNYNIAKEFALSLQNREVRDCSFCI